MLAVFGVKEGSGQFLRVRQVRLGQDHASLEPYSFGVERASAVSFTLLILPWRATAQGCVPLAAGRTGT